MDGQEAVIVPVLPVADPRTAGFAKEPDASDNCSSTGPDKVPVEVYVIVKGDVDPPIAQTVLDANAPKLKVAAGPPPPPPVVPIKVISRPDVT